MQRILIVFILTVIATPSRAQDVAGDWQGTLNTGAGELRLVLHIAKAADGALKATLDSIDQNSKGIPVSAVTLKDSRLSLEVAAVHGTYEGKVAADGKTVSGTRFKWEEPPSAVRRAERGLWAGHSPATQLSLRYRRSFMTRRRSAFAPLSPFHPSASALAAGPAASSSLHDGQRFANPGFPGFNSNSSPHTTQILIGNAILCSRSDVATAALASLSGVEGVVICAKSGTLPNSENIAGTAYRAGPGGIPRRE
jgi:hypothetical protein